jgi:SSS family solute:Na+ symporter
MALVDYCVVILFLVFIFWAGSYFYKWIKNPDDFFVSGRQLTPFILAATITATNVNLYSFVGQAGVAYSHGISIIWQTWTGNMALVLAGLFIVPLFRTLKVRTIPEFLELRYNQGVRVLIGILWIFRLIFWLGVVLYTAAIAAQTITGIKSFTVWVAVFALIAIFYTMMGGMWAVALTDTIQFVLMLLGALLILPIVMGAVGWLPGLVEKLPAQNLQLVTQTGLYNWKFVLAISILGLQWASLDQGLLQRAFSAKDTKTVTRGMVLAGIITTPFALLWNFPGLAAAVLHPGLSNPDSAIPFLIANHLPSFFLGLVVCGLLASQLSTIDSNLNAVVTLYVNDIYTRVIKKEASPQLTLKVVRIATVFFGLLIIAFSYLVPRLGGAVQAYLTVIGIMDMPLFVVAVVYGLLLKRVNWQGAVGGYLIGALSGTIVRFVFHGDLATSTLISAAAALISCPLISIFFPRTSPHKIRLIWEKKKEFSQKSEELGHYKIIPVSIGGRIGLGMLGVGLITFFSGVISGSIPHPHASSIALAGMILFFLGGLVRIKFT